MDHKSENWDADLEVAELSDVGMRRANNQDASVVVLASDEVAWSRRGHSFTVADGMGAHAAGELASEMAVGNLAHAYNKLKNLTPPDALRQAITETNALIYQRGQSSPDFHGMGTTCCHLVLLPQGALVGHVGDSRVYRMRERRLDQLTFDHSLAWEIEAAQKKANSSVKMNVPTNVITRSLGPHQQVQVDLEGPFPIRVGDTFLLCSDGLTGVVNDYEIGTLLSCLPVGEAAQTLVDLANVRTGPDNITVVIARVTSSRLASPKSPIPWDAVAPSEAPDQVSFALKIVAGVALLVAVMLMSIGVWVLAGVSALVGLVAGIVILMRRSGPSGDQETNEGELLGKGPHRSYEIEPQQEFIDNLSLLTRQLRTAGDNNGWAIDHSLLDDLEKQSETASQSGDLKQAVICQASAIRSVMQSLREHSPSLAE